MKKLIICNTYYQLIMAIHMRLSLFINDNVHLWLSDCCVNGEDVFKRLKKKAVFSDIKYIRIKSEIYSQSIFKKMKNVFKCNFGKIHDLNIDYYNEIIFFNWDLYSYYISDYYKKNNFTAIWSRFDEGILSYDIDNESGQCVNITRKIRRFISRDDLFFKISRYYCVFPEFKETNAEWNMIKIPKFDIKNERLLSVLNFIFDYKQMHFKQKYIFFASASDIDGYSFGETDLILKIAEHVGAENLLVKKHPRDERKIFAENNISVMENSFVPWEIMQLNLSNQDYVFLTVSSGAFISIIAMTNSNCKGIFLFSYVNSEQTFLKSRKIQIEKTLEKLHNYGLCKNLTCNIDQKGTLWDL